MNAIDSKQKSSFRLLFPIYHRSKKDRTIGVSAILIASSHTPFSLDELIIRIGDISIKPKIYAINTTKYRNRHRCRISFKINQDETRSLAIHNKIYACKNTSGELTELGSLMYNALLPKYIAAHGPYLTDEKTGTVMFFRQTVSKTLTLTARHMNVTDTRKAQVMLSAAFLMSHFLPHKRPVILYEKNARKYEESAKAVYEALVDKGYTNVFFVIDNNALKKTSVEERYRKKLIYKHTFRHYLYFFRAHTFIGTEVIAHALELRCQNIFAQRHMKSKKNTFVFLQHGVMLMVSLDSPERKSFVRKAMKGAVRIVVSSEIEATHFIDLAGYASNELIVSGLPKFDFSYSNEGADKILIMPTWRIWEFNAMRADPSRTKYTTMINKIKASIPEELRDKIITLNHPLFERSTLGIAGAEEPKNLDVLLRDVRVLITDYSSIAFDAFYRGANVIFYWEDLADCMRHYGEPTHLMVDKGTVFGDVCMDDIELRERIFRNYNDPQTEEHMQKYRRLVTYHDGHNTKRVVGTLERELIICPK